MRLDPGVLIILDDLARPRLPIRTGRFFRLPRGLVSFPRLWRRMFSHGRAEMQSRVG